MKGRPIGEPSVKRRRFSNNLEHAGASPAAQRASVARLVGATAAPPIFVLRSEGGCRTRIVSGKRLPPAG